MIFKEQILEKIIFFRIKNDSNLNLFRYIGGPGINSDYGNIKKNLKILKLKIQRKIFYILFLFFFILISRLILIRENFYSLKIIKPINKIDYKNITFAIIRRKACSTCGLFSDYIVFLGCINHFIKNGYFPIIDTQSYKNIFNEFNGNKSNENPWEFFFYQLFGQKLDNIKKKAKKIKYFECKKNFFRPRTSLFFNKILQNFWHNIAKFYLPIKKEILLEARIIYRRLFKNSNNILGILIRGTDYIAKKPRGHAIPPTPSMVIKDIKKINLKNNYDWYFISTEDDLIRDKFTKEFGFKIKYFVVKKIKYNYKNKFSLSKNNNVKGLQYSKIYLINMIILSKCIDILSANTSGSIGVFILTNGFRYSKIYNLGNYK